ncbi:hypothetical protein CDCA_CDCA08G2411 [Cyanidium caldarium]|uniref:Uncharacterized protein n=1 Tax=Cyanidium caldarium TaxID=2771 RepID=A0AAV9IW97_CYACA|nr:hypothetical protein CDCA_CDCA08G2411 [Cyanidium caldarium]
MGRGGVLWRVRRGPYGDRATIDAKRDASLGNWAGREAGATAGELMARADRETGENTRGERTADRTEDADDREQVANGTRGRASAAAADRTGCMGAEGDGSAMGIKRRRRVYCGSLCRVPTPAMLTAPNNRIDVEAAAAAPTTSPDAQLAAEPAEPVSVAADTVAAPSAAKTDDEEAVGRTLATETECAEVFAMDGADKGAEEHPTMSTAAEGDTPAVAVDPGAEHPSPPLDARFTPKRCRCGTAHIPPAGLEVHLYVDGFSFAKTGAPRYPYDRDARNALLCLDQGILPVADELPVPMTREFAAAGGGLPVKLYNHVENPEQVYEVQLRPDNLALCVDLLEMPQLAANKNSSLLARTESLILRILHRQLELAPRCTPSALRSHLRGSAVLNFALEPPPPPPQALRLRRRRASAQPVPPSMGARRPRPPPPLSRRARRPSLNTQALVLIASGEHQQTRRREHGGADLNAAALVSSRGDHEPARLRPVLNTAQLGNKPRLLRQMRFTAQRVHPVIVQSAPHDTPAADAATSTSALGVAGRPRPSSTHVPPVGTAQLREIKAVCRLEIISTPHRGCEGVIRRALERQRDTDVVRIELGSEQNAHRFATQFRRLMRGEGYTCEEDVLVPLTGAADTLRRVPSASTVASGGNHGDANNSSTPHPLPADAASRGPGRTAN